MSRRATRVLGDPLRDDLLLGMIGGGFDDLRAVGVRVYQRGERFNGRREMAVMSMPANVTFSASGLRRLPRQVGQSLAIMYRITRCFIICDCVMANVSNRFRFALDNVPM
jgi:hypothetical protein